MVRHDLFFVRAAGFPVGAGQGTFGGSVEAVQRHRRMGRRDELGRRCPRYRRSAATPSRLLTESGNDLMTDLFETHAERLKHTRRNALTFADDPEKQMLRTDVAVSELPRLVDRELDHLLGPGRKRDLAWRGRRVAAADDELD